MEVAGGGAEAAVPEQDLDSAEVGTGLEQVSGEAVPQGVQMDVLAQARGRQGTLADHGVMRLDEVRRMEQIPMLGTGKTDYKQLRALILEGTAGHAR